MGVETVSVSLTDAYGTSVPPARGTCFELRATLGGRTSRSRSLRTATRHLALERLPLPMARRLYCGPGSPAFAHLHAAVHMERRVERRMPPGGYAPFDVWSGRDVASAEGLVLQLMERAPPAAEQPLDAGGGGGGGGGGGAARPEVWRLRCGGALPSKRLLAAPSDEELELPLLDAEGAEVASSPSCYPSPRPRAQPQD